MTRRLALLTLVTWLAFAASAAAQVAVTQSKASIDGNIFDTDATDSLAFDAQVGTGSFVVVGIGLSVDTRTIVSVTDDGGNTYALLSQGGTDATTQATSVSEIWLYGATITNAMQTVTVQISEALPAPGKIVLWELDGQHASLPVEDVAVASSATGTSHAVGPVVTANAGSLLIGVVFGSNGVYSNDTGWTTVNSFTQGLAAHLAVNAASTTWTPTTAGNESTARVLVAIQPAGGEPPSGGTRARLLLMGVGEP